MEKDEFSKLRDDIYANSKEFDCKISSSKRPSKFGLCSTCTYFHYFKTLYDNESAVCGKYKSRVPCVDRIIECTDYYPFDAPDIYDMTRMAHFIEVRKEKKIGF